MEAPYCVLVASPAWPCVVGYQYRRILPGTGKCEVELLLQVDSLHAYDGEWMSMRMERSLNKPALPSSQAPKHMHVQLQLKQVKSTKLGHVIIF